MNVSSKIDAKPNLLSLKCSGHSLFQLNTFISILKSFWWLTGKNFVYGTRGCRYRSNGKLTLYEDVMRPGFYVCLNYRKGHGKNAKAKCAKSAFAKVGVKDI